jgi:hypothetical protein
LRFSPCVAIAKSSRIGAAHSTDAAQQTAPREMRWCKQPLQYRRGALKRMHIGASLIERRGEATARRERFICASPER